MSTAEKLKAEIKRCQAVADKHWLCHLQIDGKLHEAKIALDENDETKIKECLERLEAIK